MSISCFCNREGVLSVSDPRFVTCRTPRKATCCRRDLKPGDGMYIVSFFDYDDNIPSSPGYICEKCGDMALNLIDAGMCFSYAENIVEQWREYLMLEKKQ